MNVKTKFRNIFLTKLVISIDKNSNYDNLIFYIYCSDVNINR